MKLQKGIPLFIALLVGVLLTYIFVNSLVVARAADSQTTNNVFPMIADFEDGVPAGWFVYGDWGNITLEITVPTIADSDPLALPGQVGPNNVLSVTAEVPTWAGFGAGLSPVQDWSDYDALSFWFYGENSGTTHEFEIQTLPGDDRRAEFVDNFAGWRQIILPFNTFGAGGAYDVTQVDNWVFVLDGTNGWLLLDNLQLVNLQPFADFEDGVPAGWFVYGDWGNISIDITNPTIPDSDPLALPGQVGPNDILSVTATVPTWGGFGAALNPVQDWSDMQGVSFWFYGENSGTIHEFEIQTVPGDDRRAAFVDDFAGWQLITLPFTTFGTPPYDVSQVDNWVFILDGTDSSFKLDDVGVYGDAGNVTLRVQFTPDGYTVLEGETVTLTVALNITSTETVTVAYETADGTADSSDYVPVSGTLIFPAIVKAAHEHCSIGISTESVVTSPAELERRVAFILDNHRQPALVEEFIDGRELHQGAWGNGKVSSLPATEMDYCELSDIRERLFTYEAKYDSKSRLYEKIALHVPALLEPEEESELERIVLAAYQASGCRDYGRIDVRLRDGVFHVIDINPNPDINPLTSLTQPPADAGYSYGEMGSRIVNLAAARHPRFRTQTEDK
ncbi:MAG: carbohydrate binding domain-containing protein [Chloroflexota bacterium]